MQRCKKLLAQCHTKRKAPRFRFSIGDFCTSPCRLHWSTPVGRLRSTQPASTPGSGAHWLTTTSRIARFVGGPSAPFCRGQITARPSDDRAHVGHAAGHKPADAAQAASTCAFWTD